MIHNDPNVVMLHQLVAILIQYSSKALNTYMYGETCQSS